ncbi:MAG: hypothetical protein ABIW85_01950 [Variovorax sp.]
MPSNSCFVGGARTTSTEAGIAWALRGRIGETLAGISAERGIDSITPGPFDGDDVDHVDDDTPVATPEDAATVPIDSIGAVGADDEADAPELNAAPSPAVPPLPPPPQAPSSSAASTITEPLNHLRNV